MSASTIKEILDAFVDSGGTVVLSSHVMELVERLCSDVAVIAAGQVRAVGTVDEVRGGRSLEERFVDLVGAGPTFGGAGMVAHLLRLKAHPAAQQPPAPSGQLIGLAFGVLYGGGAVATACAALIALRFDRPSAGISGPVITLGGSVLVLAWIVVPMFAYGTDPTLDPRPVRDLRHPQPYSGPRPRCQRPRRAACAGDLARCRDEHRHVVAFARRRPHRRRERDPGRRDVHPAEQGRHGVGLGLLQSRRAATPSSR